MHTRTRNRILTALLFALVVLGALPAAAQTRVRVIRDQTTIWRQGFAVIATVVNAGTVLEVVARQDRWYVVYLPSPPPNTRPTGLIAVNAVQPIGGTPGENAPAPGASQPRGAGQPGARPPQPRPTFVPGFRGFGQAGYGWQTASDTFRALFGAPGTVWFGGGGQYTMASGFFVQGSVDYSRRTGTRVFVLNGEVFELDIDETVTMVPVMGTVGYRFARRGAIPYVGGGVGVLLYKETSEFADADEDVSKNIAAYHLLGGVEWRMSRRTAAAIEVQYSRIPEDITGGLGDAFDEHDLGGVLVRGKLLFGGR